MITPESSWEKDFREYEENHLSRPKSGESVTKCSDCKPEGMECYKLPFITNVRLVNFLEFGSRTFVEGRIEDCPWKKVV